MPRSRHSALLGSSLLVLVLSPLFAADTAKGTFRFGKVKFQPVDVLAYRQDGTDPNKPVTVVALTSFKIDRPAVVEAINTAGALIEQASRSETGAVVMVTLSSPDRCGLSGFLAAKQQQLDLGSDFPAKTAALTTLRVAGECFTAKPGKMFDDEFEFRLPYDAAITAIPKPAPVPAGGGEPGQSYLALVKAIQAADWAAAHIRLPKEQVPETPPKAADMGQYFHGLALNYPKTASVTGGLVKGDRALLDIQGKDNDGKRIKGVVAMKKTAGQWQVVDQSLFFAE